MKRLFVSIAILLFIAFAACKKASGPADLPSVQPNNNLDSMVSVSATINGTKWQTDSAFGDIVKTSGNDSTQQGLLITANNKTNGNNSTIIFNITNYTGPNTYIIDPPANAATYYIGTIRHYANSGQLVILSDSAYALKGTFTFTADTFVVANGVFNVAAP